MSGANTNTKILFVDDESHILDAIRRQLRGQFSIETSTSVEQALTILKQKGPFSVVVSDMRMPEMDGAHFLQHVKKIAPDTIRMMLTGNSEQETATRAINEGSIFRFLSKPCSNESLQKVLGEAIRQYQLVTAEKELLQKTLSGSVKLLTDILSLIDSETFNQTIKLRPLAKELGTFSGLNSTWDIELAVMLAPIGLITVPSAIIKKHRTGQELSAAEQKLLAGIPEVSRNLVANIPRLEGVAEMLRYSQHPYSGVHGVSILAVGPNIPLGGRILKLLLDLALYEARGLNRSEAAAKLGVQKGQYDPALLAHLLALVSSNQTIPRQQSEHQQPTRFEIKPDQLIAGQKILAPVETLDGVLLIGSGVEITDTLIHRLRNYASTVGIKEPIVVDCLMPVSELVEET